MKCLIACVVLIAAASAGYAPASYYHASSPYLVPSVAVYAKPVLHIGGNEYRSQDTLGQYSFGFTSDNGIQKSETRGVDGGVSGNYGFISPEGQRVEVKYTAGEHGFEASGAAIPTPVPPTAEVLKATQEHEAAIREMEAKIAAAPKPLPDTVPYSYPEAMPYTSYAHPVVYTAYKPMPVVAYKPKPPQTPPQKFQYSSSL